MPINLGDVSSKKIKLDELQKYIVTGKTTNIPVKSTINLGDIKENRISLDQLKNYVIDEEKTAVKPTVNVETKKPKTTPESEETSVKETKKSKNPYIVDYVNKGIKSTKDMVENYDWTNAPKDFIERQKNIGEQALSGLFNAGTSMVDAPLQELQNDLQKGAQRDPNWYVNNAAINLIGTLSPGGTYAIKQFTKQFDKEYQKKNVMEKVLDNINDLKEATMPIGLKEAIRTYGTFDKQALGGKAPKNIEKLSEAINKPADKYSEKVQKEAEKFADDPFNATNLVGAAAQSVGFMGPSIIAGAVTKDPDLALATMGAAAKGASTKEALQKGVELDKAINIGDAKAFVEILTEMMTGGVSIFGKGALDDIAMKTVNKIATKPVQNFLLKQGVGVAGEIGEELVANVLDNVIDKYTTDPDKKIGSWEEFWNTIITTTLSTLMLNGISGRYTRKGFKANQYEMEQQYQNQKAVQDLGQRVRENPLMNIKRTYDAPALSAVTQNNTNNIQADNNVQLDLGKPNLTERIDNKLWELQGKPDRYIGISDVGTDIKNAVNNQFNETTQYTNKTLENLMTNKNVSDNEKIQNFRNSLEKENVQDKQGFYNAVEKVIADKDYNVIMDSSIKNQKGQSVDALISNENGITIKINPNSPRAGEILLMHEVTHGIQTQEINNLINDYASKNPEFNAALEDLKNTYGVKDVTPEVAADISGQLFGNQEFISQLSTENPSLFKRIYNKIVEIANKLTGNSNEKLFMEDLKAKWEKAYRESSVESAQENLQNETKYSQNAVTIDNEGTKLSKGQQDFFENSKARDKNGNLVVVYHATGQEAINPFYVFDPRNSSNYAFGEDIANFWTDSQELVETYFGNEKYKNVDTSKTADTSKKGRWLYKGYLNIEKPYVIDCEGRNFADAVIQFTEEANTAMDKAEKYKEQLSELAKESEQKYQSQQEKRFSKDIDNSIMRQLNKYELPSPDENLGEFLDSYGITEDLAETYGNERLDKYNYMTIGEFVKDFNNENILKEESTWFENNYKKILGKDIDTDVLPDKTWYKMAKEMFTEEAKKNHAPASYHYTTRDVVQYIINENKTKLQNEKYDGVIFENIIDNAGFGLEDMFTKRYKPGTVYVTFNSNQFKSIDNKNPTSSSDIRYKQNAQKWQEWLEKNFPERGTTTKLNDKSTKQNTVVAENKSGEKITLKQDKNNPVVYNEEAIARDTKDLNKMFKDRTVSKGNLKVSNFYSNITEKSKFIDTSIREFFKTEDDIKFYNTVSNEESMNKANQRIGNTVQSQQKAFDDFISKTGQFDSVDMAEGWILLKRFNDAANYDASYLVAKKMREMGTKSGQAIQILNLESRLTPEGMYKWAVNELMEAEEKFNKEKGRTQKEINKYKDSFRLTPEETEFIKSQMEKIQQMPDGRKKIIELAKINSMLQNKLPHKPGQSVKAWMRISMLLNPKTQVRNVVGNSLIVPVNMVSDIFASGVDKIVSKKTGVKTMGAPSLGGLVEYGKGFAKGIKEATEDYRLGIDTKNIKQDRFDIGQGKAFNENHSGPLKGMRNSVAKKLNAINDFLSYVMDAGDRGFYKGAVEYSLYNQQKINNTAEITDTMRQIAENEGLQRTWNDTNNYTQAVLNLRRAINDIGTQMHVHIGEYGLGDLLIPFAKTPANLTKAIVDYSPLGFLDAISEGKNLKHAIETGNFTSQQQHDFAQTIGKATAGTLLYALGFALAKAKITTGNSDDDKDLKNFMRNNLGIQPYSIKIGNKTYTYDWAQPIAAPFAITADIEKGRQENMSITQAIQHYLTSGFNILMQQSFMTGVNEVLTDNDGVLQGIEKQIVNIPATAIPTFLKQITDLFDGTKRITYTKEGPIENMKKTAKSKIPTESKKLAPQVDVLGNEIEKYGGENNWFNVFINPSNTDKGKQTPVAKEIYSLYEATKDKSIIPRKVDYTLNGKRNGEKVSKILTDKEIAAWQKASGKIVTKEVENAMKNSTYKSMDDEEKAAVINKIVGYAYNKSKSETFNVDLAKTFNGAEKAKNKGIPIADYYISTVSKNSK